MSGDLANRVALVTGSSAGIGRSLAEALGARSAAVVVHGVDPATNAGVLEEWRDRGWRCMASDADLGSPTGSALLHDEVVATLGAPDILILNASIEMPEPLDELTVEAMRLQFEVNLLSSCLLLQACVPAMRARGWGRVVAVGSVQEERPNARHLFYAGLKAALTAMVLNLARSERTPGLTFNVVRPGAILTDRNRAALADETFAGEVIERIPVGRLGEPTDCAALVSLLCSESGGYLNGSVIAIDGGMRL